MEDEMSVYEMMTGDERLIELVRSRRILYNKHCLGYRGAEQKQEAWYEISEQLGVSAEECTKRWTSLRERYSRLLKQIDTHPENKSKASTNWPLFEALSFLKEYVKPRPARNSFCAFSDASFLASPRPKRFKPICTEGNDTNDAYNPLDETRKEKVETPFEFETVQYLEPREKVKVKRDISAIESFGQTVAAIISEMNEAKQARAMRVLFNALISIKSEPEDSKI